MGRIKLINGVTPTVTLEEGFNIATVAASTGATPDVLSINYADNMADINVCITATVEGVGLDPCFAHINFSSAAAVNIALLKVIPAGASNWLDMTSGSETRYIHFVVYAKQ